MNWDALVKQLGWQSVVEKWNRSQITTYEKDHNANDGPEFGKTLLETSSVKTSERIPPSSDYLTLRGSSSNRNRIISGSTNPFLDNNNDNNWITSGFGSPSPGEDAWFYLDPKEIERGPFEASEMADWYDSGYFDMYVRVRKTFDRQYIRIEELAMNMKKEIFSSFKISDLVPTEYISQASMFVNPFRTLKPLVKPSTVESQDLMKEKCFNYQHETYAFDICGGLKDLSLNVTKPNRTPITFKINGVKLTKFGEKDTILHDGKENHSPSKNLIAKMDALQQFWLDIANTKLTDPKLAEHIQVQMMGRTVDAVLQTSARFSFLGAGSIHFLKFNKIESWEYKTKSKTIKTDDGTNAKIIGYAYLVISHQGITVSDFKLLIVPDLKCFLYLGTDFINKFLPKLQLLPPGMEDARSSFEAEQFTITLKTDERLALEKVVRLFPSIHEKGLGLTSLEMHTIKIVGNPHPFQCSTAENVGKDLLKVIDRMIACDIIEQSSSPWKLAISFKSENDVIKLDLRRINAMTVHDTYETLSKNEIIERLRNSNYISCIALGWINWHILLDPESRKYTAFEVNDQLPRYQFKRMPVGLKNAQKRIQRLLDQILPQARCLVVSNMLLLHSDNFLSHINLLTEVANGLNDHRIHVDITKSTFCRSATNCLGYVVGSGMKNADSIANNCISSLKFPKARNRLKLYLEIFEWYRTFIPNYEQLMLPLVLLSESKSESISFTTEAFNAFIKVQEILSSALTGPNYDQPFYVQCNVTFRMMAGILYQVDSAGNQHPIGYYHKELRSGQTEYTVTELECQAVVACLRSFRDYIEDKNFVVITDKKILLWALEQNRLPPRLLNYCTELQLYNFTVEQRNQPYCSKQSILNQLDVALFIEYQTAMNASMALSNAYTSLRTAILTCPYEYPDYKIDGGLIYCRRDFSCGDLFKDVNIWKLFVDDIISKSLVCRVHIDSFGSHRNLKDMKDLLSTKFYWPLMEFDVNYVIRNCQRCNMI